MLSPDDQQRLARYVAGDGDPAWRAATRDWIAADTERQAVADAYARIQAVSPAKLPTWNESAQWETLRESVGIARTPSPRAGVRQALTWGGWVRRRTLPFATGALVAAAAVLAIMFLRAPSSIGALHGSREYATAPGQRETVTLADGTEITLAPASRLQVAPAYGRTRRDVSLLEGEGYFVVHHDPHRPFVVHARNGLAEDVGTRFVVRAYREEPTVRVVVADGIVALTDSAAAGRRSELGRGALGVLDRTGDVSLTDGVDVDRVLAWTRGELAFDRTPLSAIGADLSRWYGLDVRVAQGVGDRQFTGRYTTESPDDVLASIAAATGTVVQRHGRVVTIVGR
jgi:transmembrane sensor